MTEAGRDKTLRVFALLFGLLAISNFLKPLQLSPEVGFVLFGTRLEGSANALAGPAFGLYLAAYALALWRRLPAALPLALIYVAYVAANLVLFNMTPLADDSGLIFGLAYTAVALGVSGGSAWLLWTGRPRSDQG
jgi:Zn-dependent protease